MGYWDTRHGMLDVVREECWDRRRRMLGWREPTPDLSRVLLEPRGGMSGQSRENAGTEGWNVGLKGWNAGIERLNVRTELGNAGMYNQWCSYLLLACCPCRGCPILWMIPCCLFEPPPSRYNFLKIQSMLFFLILLSLWILLFTPWSGSLHVLWILLGLILPAATPSPSSSSQFLC